MKTKIFFTTLFLIFYCTINSFAQKIIDNELKEKIKYTVEQLDNSFRLEKSKRTVIEDIFTEFYINQQKLKNNIQGSSNSLRQGFVKQNFQSLRKQNEDLIAERERNLKKELSAEQYKKWVEIIEPSLHKKRH